MILSVPRFSVGLLSSAALVNDSSAENEPVAPLSMQPTHKRSNALDSSRLLDIFTDSISDQVKALGISDAVQSLIPILQIHPLDDLMTKKTQIDNAFGDILDRFQKRQELPNGNNAAMLTHKALLIASVQAKYNPNDLKAALLAYEADNYGIVTDVMATLELKAIPNEENRTPYIKYSSRISRICLHRRNLFLKIEGIFHSKNMPKTLFDLQLS